MTKKSKPDLSRRSTLALMGAGAVTFATPWVAHAQAKTIKVGMPTILSGRVAQLGTSSRNAVTIEVEKINAAGGLAGSCWSRVRPVCSARKWHDRIAGRTRRRAPGRSAPRRQIETFSLCWRADCEPRVCGAGTVALSFADRGPGSVRQPPRRVRTVSLL